MDWEKSTLGQIGVVSGGLTKNAKRRLMPLQRPYLRVANVYANELRLDDVSTIGLTEDEFERTRLVSDDLLIVEGNGSVEQIGRAAIWDGSILDCCHQNHLIRWRSDGTFHPVLALYWLMSPKGRNSLIALAHSTTGLHTLSISKVSSVPVDVPSGKEQLEIVRRVQDLFVLADVVESKFRNGVQHVGRLKPSILAKAFRGELVPQDSEDESASVLLERIRQQRDSEQANSKTKKTPSRPRAPKAKAAMTKSRFDEDVQGKPYLANFIKESKKKITAEDLFRKADLPLVDFYKQLDFEVKQKMIVDRDGQLEAA